MAKAYKIGTVETLRVNSSGRRLYCNLDAFTVQAYGIEVGDLLKVKIQEGIRPDDQGMRHISETVGLLCANHHVCSKSHIIRNLATL